MSRRNLSRIAKLVAAGNSDLPQNVFANKLKKYIETSQPAYKPSTYYKPSGVGGCIRKMYFERIGKPLQDKANFNLIGMGESGTQRHEVLQQYMVDLAKQDENFEWLDVAEHLKKHPVEGTTVDTNFKKNEFETKCKNELLQLSFLCDGLVKIDGKLYIMEIKTETMFKYAKHEEPFEEHKMQATCYALSLGVEDVIFLYENRDSFDKKAYAYHVTPEMKQQVVDKISLCEEYVQRKEAPKVYCESNFCPYCRNKQAKAYEG